MERSAYFLLLMIQINYSHCKADSELTVTDDTHYLKIYTHEIPVFVMCFDYTFLTLRHMRNYFVYYCSVGRMRCENGFDQ